LAVGKEKAGAVVRKTLRTIREKVGL